MDYSIDLTLEGLLRFKGIRSDFSFLNILIINNNKIEFSNTGQSFMTLDFYNEPYIRIELLRRNKSWYHSWFSKILFQLWSETQHQ